jgi:nucleotide-binding universal stress UspA family protein
MKEFKFNPVRRILVPTDFSENADHAMGYAATLASKLRSRLVLFHSIKVPVVLAQDARKN